MKKLLLVFLTIVAFATVHAQNIPNGGFEDWTKTVVSQEAYKWNTGYANNNNIIIDDSLKSTSSHTGDYSLRLNNYMSGVNRMFSFAICGGMVTSLANRDAIEFVGGFPVTSMPDSIYGYFNYSTTLLAPRDTAAVLVSFKRNGVLIRQNTFPITGTSGGYIKLGFDLLPSGLVPDTCLIAIVSTSPFYARPQSWMYVDSLWFTGSGNPIPNSGFEVWEQFGDETPDHWITHNLTHSLIEKDAMVAPSTDRHSGNLAARIESMKTGTEVKGLLQLSMMDTNLTGFPTIFRPIRLTGYYKFSHITNDLAQVRVTLFSATDSINTFTTTLAQAANYTSFQIPLSYSTAINIEKIKITALTTTNYNVATGYQGEVGSVLYLDDIGLITPCDTFTRPDVYAPVPLCTGGNTLAVTGTWNSYLWSTGAITPTITNLAAGKYKVTVKHGYCVFSDSLIVPANTIIDLPTVTSTQTFCNGATIANLVAALGTNATNVDWYAGPTGGAVLAGATALVNGSSYYAQSRNSSTGCISGSRRVVVATVNELPTARVTGGATICPGSGADISIILTGTSPWNLTYTDGTTSVPVTGQINDTLILHVTPATTRTYSVTAVSDAHCTGTSFGSSATITISGLPVTSAISGNTTLVCSASGETYSVSPNPTNKFVWSVPNDASIVTDTSALGVNSVQVNFGTTSSNISVYQVNQYGCIGSSKNLAVTLTGCPFGADFTANTTDACPNDTVLFTSTSIGTKPSTTYAWNFGAGATPASIGGIGPHNVVYSTSGTKTVELTINDGTSDTETKTDYISVRTLPTIVLTDSKSCGDGEIVFTATTTDGSSVEFSLGDGTTVDGTDNSAPYQYAPVINSEDTIQVIARAISNIGCVGNWSGASTGISYPLPLTGSIETANNGRKFGYLDVACLGDSRTYSVNPANTDHYAWVIDNQPISQTNESEITLGLNQNGGKQIISVSAISDKGCLGIASEDSIFVSIPAVTIGDAQTSICEGTSHTFTTTPLFVSYVWSDGSKNPTFVATKVDTISVIVTDTAGCSATDTSIVIVNANPVLELGNDTIICDEMGYVLNLGEYTTYTWSTGENGKSITIYPGTKAITLTVTNDEGCQATDTLIISECSASALGEISNVFTPNDDEFNQSWKIEGIEIYPKAKIEVFDRWGRKVYMTENGYHNDWEGTFNGKKLPMDNYYYIIDLLGDGKMIIQGNVAIVK